LEKKQLKKENYNKGKKVTFISIAVNILLSILKLVVGFFGNSAALLADGLHSLSDLVTDAFLYFGLKFSHKEADDDHPYGHGKFETLSVYFVSSIIIITAFAMGYEALSRLGNKSLVAPPFLTLVVAAISIFSKEFLFRISLNTGKKINSNALIANAWHHRSDALSSIAAFVGIAGALFGWPVLDPIAALVVSLIMAKVGIDLFQKSIKELTDSIMAVDPDTRKKIAEIIQTIPEILDSHFLIPRKLGPDILVDIHIVVDPLSSVSEGHQVSEKLRKKLMKEIESVTEVLVHVDSEPDDDSDVPVYSNRAQIEQDIQRIIQEKNLMLKIKKITPHYNKKGMLLDLVVENEGEKEISLSQLKEKNKILNDEIISLKPEIIKIHFSLKLDI